MASAHLGLYSGAGPSNRGTHLADCAAALAALHQPGSFLWVGRSFPGLGGSFYRIAALVLGGGLLASAAQVWRRSGNKVAWKMYRHSSMYLAFLFAALMVDALL